MVLKSLFTIAALDGLSFSLTLVTIIPYLHVLGVSHFFRGLMDSTCALIALMWNPLSGSLSDSIGRKPILLTSLFICICANLLMSWTSSLALIFLARILAAFGSQIMTLVKSLIDDNVESKDATMAAINKLGAVTGFCFIFGSLFGGFLGDFKYGQSLAFLLISGMFTINFGLVYFTIKEKTIIKKNETSSQPENRLKVAFKNLMDIEWPKFWDILAMKGLLELTNSVFHFNFGMMLTEQFGASGKSFGYIFSAMSIMVIVTSLALAKVKQYFYPKDDFGLIRLLHGNLMLSSTYIFLSFTTNLSYYMILIIAATASRMLIDTTLTEVLLKRASSDEKGSVMATFDSTMSLAQLIAPLLSAIITEMFGVSVTIFLCFLPILAGAAIAYSQKVKLQ